MLPSFFFGKEITKLFRIEKASQDRPGLHPSEPIVIGDSPPSNKATDEEILIKREPDPS